MKNIREQAKKMKNAQKYDEAIELYAQIYSENVDKWVAWEYAYCLKKIGDLDKAIKISRCIYLRDKDFKHNNDILAWLLYEKYFKRLNNDKYTYEEIQKLYDISIFILKIVPQEDSTPYTKTIIKILKLLKGGTNSFDKKILEILEKIDVEKLADVPHKFIKNNREQEFQSDKEMYFAYKTKALFNLKQFDKCIEDCDKALAMVTKFHHNNDIWIKSREAMCLGEKGQIKKAIDSLVVLSIKKEHWIFYHNIGKLYRINKDTKNALFYFCRAALTSDPYEMKVGLFYDMAELFLELNDSTNTTRHALLAKNIRIKQGWNIPKELNDLLGKFSNDICGIETNEKEFWVNKIYFILKIYNGFVFKIHINGKFGFIKTDKSSYYFRSSSVIGKMKVKNGDKVKFVLIPSYDVVKKKETEEAAYIIIDNQSMP